MARTLPGTLVPGGGAVPNVTGNYATISFGPLDHAAGTVRTDLIVAGLVMPFAFRIEKVSWSSLATVSAAAITIQLERHASAFSTTGMVDLLSADVNPETTANGFALATGTTPTLAVRDLARGDRVFLALTTDVTGAAGRTSMMISGFIQGFVHAAESDG